MAKRRNISKKYWLLAAWGGIILYLAFAFGAIVNREDLICSGVEVKILADSSDAFLVPQDVYDVLKTKKIELVGKRMDNIDAAWIEKEILDNTLIDRVDVYKTIDGKVRIEVEQREPIARLINTKGKSLYLDTRGQLMPPSSNHTAYVPVVVGHIPFPKDISERDENDFISQIYSFILFIEEDEFLSAQFGQIYVDKNQELTLYPRVGNQEIYFGKIDEYELKFKKLMALYEQVFSKTGWRKYKAVNLKYKGQVVCTKI